MSKAQIIGKCVGIALVVLLLIGAVVAGVRMTPHKQACVSVTYVIEDAQERMYLMNGELGRLLLARNLYPVGRTLQRGDLHRIERTITEHPMVRHAECYLTPREQMYIRLTQRVPVLRVETDNLRYFIDSDRHVMPYRETIKDPVLTVRGHVSVGQAAGDLADFALWLYKDRYWRERIQSVTVQSPFAIYIHLRGDYPRVLMGSMSGFERKLAKLRTFLDDGEEETADKHYRELDIRFKGQVIGRR